MSTERETNYQPEMWAVPKDAICAAIIAAELGLEYARSELVSHDSNLGRTIQKNRRWAEAIENDIRKMDSTLRMLRSLPSGYPAEG